MALHLRFLLKLLLILSLPIALSNCKPVAEDTETLPSNEAPPSGTQPSQDSQPPMISNGVPSGLALPSGTTSQSISVTTDEISVCRYAVNSGDLFSTMTDLQATSDGLEHSILIENLQDNTSYTFYIKCQDSALNVNAEDDDSASFSVNAAGAAALVSDDFSGTGALLGYTTTKPEVLPTVGRVGDRYRAELTDNAGNKTLHFNGDQGRLDAKLVTFPFEYIARNIGIGTLADSQVAANKAGSTFMFSGIQVHTTTLTDADSAHIVVGHRGNTKFTIEGKNTVNGSSSVNDIGANTAPAGRADIRVVGNADRSLTIYWQTPNFATAASDSWTLYRGTGNLPGATAAFGPNVYIGLITYAFGSGSVPFVGTCDSVELSGE